MTRRGFTSSCSVCYALAIGFFAIGCHVSPVEGRYPCAANSDCPDDWVCDLAAGADSRCYSSPEKFPPHDTDTGGYETDGTDSDMGSSDSESATETSSTDPVDTSSANDTGSDSETQTDIHQETPADVLATYGHCRKVFVPNASRSSDLVEFPVPVHIASDFPYDESLSPSGADLRFISSNQSSFLPHSVEAWRPGGDSLVWVRMPLIPAGSDQGFFWMCYGAAEREDTQSPGEIFDGSFLGVWHLAEQSGTTAFDDTGQTPGTYRGGPRLAMNGAIGGLAVGVDGTDDFIDLGPLDIAPDGPNNDGLTLEVAAFSPAALGSCVGRLVSKARSAAIGGNIWTLATVNESDGACELGVSLSVGGTNQVLKSSTAVIPRGAWFYAAATYDGSRIRLFANGVMVAEAAANGAIERDSSVTAAIGAADITLNGAFRGLIDEVRISNRARSADWISAAGQAVRIGAE